MKTLKIIETFAGIGAQHKAITRINDINKKNIFEVVATCEWDIFANISYNAIHKNKYKIDKVDIEKKKKYLKAHTWSRDGIVSIKEKSFDKLSDEVINHLFNSVKGHKNFGSVITLDGGLILEKIGDFDILTYSFPCQNLSTAGGFHGVNSGMKENSKSKSGLIWEIKRILLDLDKEGKLPRYLLLENVPSITKRYINDYKKWTKFLKSLNYSTNTQVLNAVDFGIPQRRKRAFVL